MAVDDRLIQIVTEYQTANYPDFAVPWIPANVPGLTCRSPRILLLVSYLLFHSPILWRYFSAFSKTDCFHPSENAHAFFATNLWNRMTAGQDERVRHMAWSDVLEFRCLEGNDRFRTTALMS